MKRLNQNNSKYQLVLTLLFLVQFAQAQPGFDDGDDVVDVPAAPIDQWLLPMFVLGLVLVYWYTRKSIFSNSK